MEHPQGLPPGVPPNSKKRKWKRTRDWTEAETSALLERVNLPKFRYQKRKQYYMKWDDIAVEIQNAVGSDPAVITGKRCNERMKTLRGCYEKITTEGKEASITEEEWRKSKGIAWDWWCNAIGEFCGPRKGKLKDQTPATKTYVGSEKKSKDETPAMITYSTRFSSLTKLQRSTLLDLHFLANYFAIPDFDVDWALWRTCNCLSIVQNRSCLAIYEDVIALKKMGLFRRKADDEESEGSDGEGGEGSDDDEEVISYNYIFFSGLLTHETFFEKAKNRNPAYDTRRTIMDNAMVTFDATCAPSRITMLFLHDCGELEVVDLRGFRELRFLSFFWCAKLREMIVCECLEELRCLEVWFCRSYHGYPPLQKMPSLQEFSYQGDYVDHERVVPGGELDVSGCVLLRRLEIFSDRVLSSIRGLEELRSLTSLVIYECKGVRNLPDIGHMKDLTYLRIACTAVEEIKGIERLSSLKELVCWGSELKTLPDLTHLPHLHSVRLRDCPVVIDPFSLYYKFRTWADFNPGSRHVDVSDTE